MGRHQQRCQRLQRRQERIAALLRVVLQEMQAGMMMETAKEAWELIQAFESVL
jgi:hypothetical protein